LFELGCLTFVLYSASIEAPFIAQGNKKLSDAKLAKDFQAVLAEFQNAQKIAQEREKMYAPFVPEDVLQTRSRALPNFEYIQFFKRFSFLK
jgi:hypothetical protein